MFFFLVPGGEAKKLKLLYYSGLGPTLTQQQLDNIDTIAIYSP